MADIISHRNAIGAEADPTTTAGIGAAGTNAAKRDYLPAERRT